jgi:glycosyltransferase involved in cell wall biosynthesis
VVSVVIPARNAAHELLATLGALQDVEVVVAVNGSTDATAEVARAAGAKVIELERASRAAARNAGAAEASGDVLLFTDAGCVPDRGWVGEMATCLEAAPLAGGPVRVVTSAQPSAVERFDALWRFRQEQAVKEGGWTAGANLGITRVEFERLGGFDESYSAGDDVDLCVRAGQIAWCAEASVAHPASTSLWEVTRRALRQGYSATKLHKRHGGGVGKAYWRHPGGLVRGRGALAALGIEEAGRQEALVARLDYGARYLGSVAAAVRETHFSHRRGAKGSTRG